MIDQRASPSPQERREEVRRRLEAVEAQEGVPEAMKCLARAMAEAAQEASRDREAEARAGLESLRLPKPLKMRGRAISIDARSPAMPWRWR